MFDEYITQASSQYSVPEALIRAVIDKESSWNPFATGSIGEQGLMQLTPKYYPNVNRYNPKENILAGTQSLADYYKKYGNWTDALAYYNGGKNKNGSQAQAYAQDVLERSRDKYGGSEVLKVVDNMPVSVSDMIGRGVSTLWPDSSLGKYIKALLPDSPVNKINSNVSSTTAYAQQNPQEVKDFFRKFGLWILAAFLVIAGTWRLING